MSPLTDALKKQGATRTNNRIRHQHPSDAQTSPSGPGIASQTHPRVTLTLNRELAYEISRSLAWLAGILNDTDERERTIQSHCRIVADGLKRELGQ